MTKGLKVDLFIVDPQKDFMGEDDGSPLREQLPNGNIRAASLPVKGAVSDMRRVAKLIDRVGRKLNDIHVTLDSHQVVDVAHPGMWLDADGKPPAPYTLITADDIRSGMWRPRNPGHRVRLLKYVEALAKQGNYPLIIWPEHCIVGTWGHTIQDDLNEALAGWARREVANVDFVTKGTNPFTEHYGGLMAEVPDPNDPSTQLNTALLQMLQEVDLAGFAGEASSHCVRATVQQVADNIGPDHVKKFVLLTDCMSPVPAAPGTPDFPAIADAFLREMQGRGMTLMTSDQFLA